jgi:hypothetical protein
VTDEPLGSHVLELEVAGVVDETNDARSLVFKVPEKKIGQTRRDPQSDGGAAGAHRC